MFLKTLFCLTSVFLCSLVTLATSEVQFNKTQNIRPKIIKQSRKQRRSCTPVDKDCMARAESSIESDADDLKFFKECIVDYYCWEQSDDSAWRKHPTFRGAMGSVLFRKIAKRVERFFLRNNAWTQTLENSLFRNKDSCQPLRDVIAARYLYMLDVLDRLDLATDNLRTFKACPPGVDGGKPDVSQQDVCFLVPRERVTCTTDLDITLLGARSGTLAALFNAYFMSEVFDSNISPWVGKAPEDIFNGIVSAYGLEFAMPELCSGVPFEASVNEISGQAMFFIQQVVTAMLEMKLQHGKYFTDLLSDQAVLNGVGTKNNLMKMVQGTLMLYEKLENAAKHQENSPDIATVSFQDKIKITHEIFEAILKSAHKVPKLLKPVLAETAIAFKYAPAAYHTRGSLRHLAQVTAMLSAGAPVTNYKDHWLSMLENWAKVVREHGRMCEKYSLPSVACIPKLSKNLLRMTDAMDKIYKELPNYLKNDLIDVSNARKFARRCLVNVYKKGLNKIPPSETRDVLEFYNTFRCPKLERYEKLSLGCIDSVQATIRNYHRSLWRYFAEKEQKRRV